ncbi:MAG: lysophospholipid acyltransferase family protein [Verrucomicrobiota bacterium]
MMDTPSAKTETGLPAATTTRRTGGAVVPHQPKWHQRLVATIIFLAVRSLAATVRFKLDDPGGIFSEVPKEKMIFAIWHNRLVLAIILYRRYISNRDRSRRMAAMVSASKDGGMLTRVLELFNVEPVRGSSSRRGAQALREMAAWGERGLDLAITPDGPRGPRYAVQHGAIATAQLTGLAIIPVSYRVNWKFQLKTWDRFQIPLPFCLCEVTTAPAIRVPREATEAEYEALRKKLEDDLRSITRD